VGLDGRVGRGVWVTLARVAFVAYTAALLTATHWPGLAVKGPVERTDLLIHMGAFGGWAVLLFLTRWLRAPDRPVVEGGRVALAAVCFGVFDETTQPLFSRVFDWTDLMADTLGAVLGAGCATLCLVWTRGRRQDDPTGMARGGDTHGRV